MAVSVFLLVLTLLVGCQNASANPTAPGTTVTGTETPPSPPADPDTHYCTVIDEGTGRELSPIATDGEYRFFLPGEIAYDQLTFACWLGENYTVTVHGQTFEESVRFVLDPLTTRSLTVSFSHRDGSSVLARYTFVSSSANVLWLEVDESLGTVHDMHADPRHETYCYGNLAFIGTQGQYDFVSAFSLRGRGNATWEDEKKGYALKLLDGDYQGKNKISVAGMGNSASWVLVANHRDRTLIRNSLAQTLAAKLGMENAVRFVFADLYVNGEYRGLYNLMQKIECGDEQVDIPEAETDDLMGGYLLEFDNYSDTPQIRLKKSGMQVTVNAPDDLGSYSAIERRLNEAEAAIFDPYGYNWDTGLYWDDYIDVRSFAILWMVREYTMDNDATVNFRFYYDPVDGKFHGGPAWDFDNSMARNTGVFADPFYALIESGHRNSNCWLRKLMQFDGFKEEIVRLYNDHRELFDTDSDRSIYALAIQYADTLADSIAQNFTVWERQLANKSWNTPKELTYEGHFGILTDFLKGRNEFWKTYIPSLI